MNEHRLARYFQPDHYNLHLSLEARKARTFHGTVTIVGQLLQPADSVRLHAQGLTVTKSSINGQNITCTSDKANDEIILALPRQFEVGSVTIELTFSGAITDPMHGLYPCYFTLDGKKEELLATQFESHHAREVFPCIDEPEAKATFDLTLDTETDVTAISNTPVKDQQKTDGLLTTTFQTTPVMSTYLLAFVVGPLAYQEATTSDGVIVRSYATPDKKDQLHFSLDIAVKCIEFYNDYFAIPYPLAKCDLVALPDFSSGAMENWGCITFREAGLLADSNTSTRTRQYIVMVIAHELAHQWFGNLVTMKWWNDLWLNESFANWIEYLATDHLFPEWDMWTQYYDEAVYAIERDSLASVQKIQQEVNTPAEIQTLFDPAIVYAKGGSLLNMLHAYLGPDTFRDGLRIYLARHKYRNTEAHDLWAALSEVSGKDVGAFMRPWIEQAGVPVVTVGTGEQIVDLHQRRFYSNPKEAGGNDQTHWPIPLLSGGQLDLDLLGSISASAHIADQSRPLLLNQNRTGYYLSLYSSEHTATLADQVRNHQMPIIDRLGLLSDGLSLTEAGLQSMTAALTLLDAYRDESSQVVWGAISDYTGTLKMFASDDDIQLAALRLFIRDLAASQFERLGWNPKDGEAYSDTLLRPSIIGHMAYSEDEAVVARLRDTFETAGRPSDITADIRSIVMSVAVKYDGQVAYDKLLDWYKHTTSAEERTQIIAGLSGLRDTQLIAQALDLLTTETVKLQDLFYWVVYFTRSRYARDLTWQWITGHWDWIVERFGNDMHYADFPKYTAASFSKPEQLAAYKQFFEPMLDTPALARIIRQGIEDIEGRVMWRERDGQQVADYLHAYTSSNQAVTS